MVPQTRVPRRGRGWIPGRARLGQLILLTATLLSVLSSPALATPAAPQHPGHPDVRKVLVFSLPRVTWADLADVDLPHLTGLLSQGMVAKLSPRTAGPRTQTADGYATLGAGNRADGAAAELVGGYAMDRDERIDGRAAYQAYQARMGRSADGRVVHLGMPEIMRQNDENRYGAEPGALGSALNAAGLRTAVIANADAHGVLRRSAALAVMDHDGVVDGGSVASTLNEPAPTSPYGYRLSREAVLRVFDAAWTRSDLTLVEAGDLDRVDAFEDYALPEAWQKLRRDALREADALLGDLLRRVDLTTDLVLVVTPAVPQQGEELGLFAMAGPGIEPGVAVSGTTRRNGYLTLPDIAPTILERLHVPAPLSMTGTPVRLGEARPVDRALIEEYVRSNEIAVFRDRVTGPVTVVFIVLQVLTYLFASLVVLRRRRFGARWSRISRFLLLVLLAVPPIAFLSGLVPYDRLGPVGYIATLLLAASGLAAAAAWLGGAAARGRLRPAAAVLPPLALVALTWLTMIVDVLLYKGRLQLDTVFGYSPIVAGRFAGYGNFAFSLVAICTIVLVTGVWAIAAMAGHDGSGRPSATAPSGMAGRRRPLWLGAIAAVLVFTVVVDGYPAYGSDVGGVLAAVPAFTVLLLLLAGVRVTWRRLVLIGLLTVATIGVFALVDTMRPPEERTHLGRLVMADTDGLVMIIQRKLFANLGILTSSTWTWVAPLALLFLIVLSSRRFRKGDARTTDAQTPSPLGVLRRDLPGMEACLWGSLVVAVLGFGLNDSGIAVPAMMSTVLLPYLGYLILRRQADVDVPEPVQVEIPDRAPEPEPAPQT